MPNDITIVVTEITRSSVDRRRFKAQLKGHTKIWAPGQTIPEAIGNLIIGQGKVMGIHLENRVREEDAPQETPPTGTSLVFDPEPRVQPILKVQPQVVPILAYKPAPNDSIQEAERRGYWWSYTVPQIPTSPFPDIATHIAQHLLGFLKDQDVLTKEEELQTLITEGKIFVNGLQVTYKEQVVHSGDVVRLILDQGPPIMTSDEYIPTKLSHPPKPNSTLSESHDTRFYYWWTYNSHPEMKLSHLLSVYNLVNSTFEIDRIIRQRTVLVNGLFVDSDVMVPSDTSFTVQMDIDYPENLPKVWNHRVVNLDKINRQPPAQYKPFDEVYFISYPFILFPVRGYYKSDDGTNALLTSDITHEVLRVPLKSLYRSVDECQKHALLLLDSVRPGNTPEPREVSQKVYYTNYPPSQSVSWGYFVSQGTQCACLAKDGSMIFVPVEHCFNNPVHADKFLEKQQYHLVERLQKKP
jgi:23S rRNA-/tRNA-specific pseudouridylate synthase